MDESQRAPETGQRLKSCPLCGGTLPPNIDRCLFCGSLAQTPPSGVGPVREKDTSGPALLSIIVLCTVFLLLFVARLSPLQSPLLALAKGALAIGFTAGILAWVEARAFDPVKPLRHAPEKWFAFMLLAWPVALPLYLRERASHGFRNYTMHGLVVATTFCLATLGFSARQMLAANPGARRGHAQLKENRIIDQRTGRQHYQPYVETTGTQSI